MKNRSGRLGMTNEGVRTSVAVTVAPPGAQHASSAWSTRPIPCPTLAGMATGTTRDEGFTIGRPVAPSGAFRDAPGTAPVADAIFAARRERPLIVGDLRLSLGTKGVWSR